MSTKEGLADRLMSKYRVDNVPFYLYPFFIVFSYLAGSIYVVYFRLVRWTSRVEIEGSEHLRAVNPNAIFCVWHDSVFSFCSLLGLFTNLRRHVWLNHPHWYMKPIHAALYLQGISRLILGSSGNGGRSAAEELERYLREGYSTMLNPDGPYGPPHVIKKGALHLSLHTGVPILPMHFQPTRFFRFVDWDRKIIILPFGKLKVRIGQPIYVTAETFGECGERLTAALGEY